MQYSNLIYFIKLILIYLIKMKKDIQLIKHLKYYFKNYKERLFYKNTVKH